MRVENSSALCDYWRRCLADVDLRSPSLSEALLPLSPEDLSAGRLPAEEAEKLFRAAESPQRRSRGKTRAEEDDRLTSASILGAPIGLRRWFHHGTPREADTQKYYPLWIPARLAREGATLSGTQFSPWISREFLEPVNRDVPVVGSLEDLERFLTRQSLVGGASWSQVLDYAERMFQAVTG